MAPKLRLTVGWRLDVLIEDIWLAVDDLYQSESTFHAAWGDILISLANLGVPGFLQGRLAYYRFGHKFNGLSLDRID